MSYRRLIIGNSLLRQHLQNDSIRSSLSLNIHRSLSSSIVSKELFFTEKKLTIFYGIQIAKNKIIHRWKIY